MGAGCYYTNEERQRSFWVDLNPDLGENYDYDEILESVKDLITEDFDYYETMEGTLHHHHDWYEIAFESTYYGDGIVLHLNYSEHCLSGHMGLARHHWQAHYDKIARALIKAGMELRIATSGYTSAEYKP